MSVSSNDPRRTYNGDGVSVNFATPYFLVNADLKVYVGGVLKTITTDYTVTGAGVTAGGTVTFLSAPAAGTGNVIIIREPDQLQSSQLPSNDPFPSKTVETMIDKLTMIVQRLFDKLTRTLTLSDTDSSSVSLTLPPASALKFFRWNASANAIENVDILTLGAFSTASPSFSGTLTHSGDIVLSGTGKRITGDFSNATVANRLLFQTTTSNANTSVSAIPNGTSTFSSFVAENSSTPDNGSFVALYATAAESQVVASKRGSGSYLPMTFYAGGSERMRIDSNGVLTANSSGTGGDVSLFQSSAASAETALRVNNTQATSGSSIKISNSGTNTQITLRNNSGGLSVYANQTAGAGSTAGTQCLAISTSGEIAQVAPARIGYSTGAGGTVTQATSKSTSVTLNTPTGQITMNNAALAGGASVSFQVTNSLAATSDVAVVSSPFATADSYRIETSRVGAGFIVIRVTNITGGSLSDAVTINFEIIKGASA